MRRRTRGLVAAALIAGLATGVTTAAAASTGGSADEEGETALTGAELEQASAVAVAWTGGGRVTATEVGDEDSRYEVEVTMDDGTEIDVQLDASFAVVERAGDADPAD